LPVSHLDGIAVKSKSINPGTIEKQMRQDDFIVSKTDAQGRITYGNKIFIEFSGYTEEELLGAQHNIIRHPDMPRSAFNLVWQAIKEGRECFAYVKNMAKDGSYYWVFANITPDRDQGGNITGFFSVRRQPRREAITLIERVYRTMLAAELRAGPRDAIAAGTIILMDLLREKGLSYDEFVLAI
jgi:PAS domain S-box-containing protein